MIFFCTHVSDVLAYGYRSEGCASWASPLTPFIFLTFSLSAQCVRHFAPISSNLGSEPTNFYYIFFLKKMFEKTTSVNFVGSDPRLLEIGAKWRTDWALKLKVKKIKGCQRAGSRGTALWPVPICQNIWHMGTKKIIKKTAKNSFLCLKNSTRT